MRSKPWNPTPFDCRMGPKQLNFRQRTSQVAQGLENLTRVRKSGPRASKTAKPLEGDLDKEMKIQDSISRIQDPMFNVQGVRLEMQDPRTMVQDP